MGLLTDRRRSLYQEEIDVNIPQVTPLDRDWHALLA